MYEPVTALAPDMVSGARERQLERGAALVSLASEAGRTLFDPIGQWGRASSALSSRFEGQVNQYASGDTYGATMADICGLVCGAGHKPTTLATSHIIPLCRCPFAAQLNARARRSQPAI